MVSRNVTVNPTDQATPVSSPEIGEIRNLKSGAILDAKSFVGSLRYDNCIKTRDSIRDKMVSGEPRFACAICSVPVYLVATAQKKWFFRHCVEDGSCPAVTRGSHSEEQIRAMKYGGAKESVAHKRLKERIVTSLQTDPQFSDIQVEATWRGILEARSFRRPDVQARYNGYRIAFEAQLSTTFLDVVVGRKSFYRSEGALLVWILPWFDPTYRRLTVDDILFNNNSNVLVVDQETVEASRRTGQFTLRCCYRRPVMDGDAIISAWENRLVPWNQLQLNKDRQQAFYFDCETEEQSLCPGSLGAKLINFLTTYWKDDDYEHRQEDWIRIRTAFQEQQIKIPFHPDATLRNLICAVESARVGEPVGFRYAQLIEIAHHLSNQYSQHLLPFGFALRVYGHLHTMREQDKSGRWNRKGAGIRKAIEMRDQRYLIEPSHAALLSILYPALRSELQTWIRPAPELTTTPKTDG